MYGRVVISARLSEFFKFRALLGVQFGWDFHLDFRVEIAFGSGLQGWHPLIADAECSATLRTGRDLQRDSTLKRGHADLTAEGGRGEWDRNIAAEISAVPRKYFVLPHMDDYIQIALAAGSDSCLAVPRRTQARSVVDSGRDFEFDTGCFLDATLTAARTAGFFYNSSCTLAVWAGLCHLEKSP
jgi:hypothetical protein